MAEIEFTIPTIQYGNVKLRGTPEEFGVELAAAGSIGEMVAVYTNLFTQGFRVGSERDVEYNGSAASAPAPEPEDDDLTATRIIQGQLGSTTVIEHTDSEPSADDGTTSELPWEGEVKAAPKPWENQGAPKAPVKAPDKGERPKVATIDW